MKEVARVASAELLERDPENLLIVELLTDSRKLANSSCSLFFWLLSVDCALAAPPMASAKSMSLKSLISMFG